MASTSCCAFSGNGKYYAQCTTDGKLKIWATETNVLKQEYIPSQHLSNQFSCIAWISTPNEDDASSKSLSSSARKKKRKAEQDSSSCALLALGTKKGEIILYGVSSGSAVGKLVDCHSKSVNGLSCSNKRNSLFSCGDDKFVVEWDVNKRISKSKWKAGTRALSSILDLDDGESVLVASSTISWWDVDNKEVLKTFTGHSTDVLFLKYISPFSDGKPYFLSASGQERIINVWILDYNSPEVNSCASFSVKEFPEYLSVGQPTQDEPNTTLAVVTISGILQCYQHTINGACPKPIKPSLTVSVEDGESVIPVLGAHVDKDGTALIVHGPSSNVLTFERIEVKSDKSHINLVRHHKKPSSKEESVSKVKIPEKSEVSYLSAVQSGSVPGKTRRKHNEDSQIEAQLPMEERLNNLALWGGRTGSGMDKPPMAEHSAQLLLQGLHSKDKSILHSVFLKKDSNGSQWMRNTVMRLPVTAVVPLVRELIQLIQRKGCLAQAGISWLHVVLVVHGAHLLATGCDELSPLMGIVEARLPLLPHLQKLRGRLDLLLKREGLMENGASLAEPIQEAALLHCDESSDEESMVNDVRALSSDSDDNWDEESEDDDSIGKDSDIDDKDIEDDG